MLHIVSECDTMHITYYPNLCKVVLKRIKIIEGPDLQVTNSLESDVTVLGQGG